MQQFLLHRLTLLSSAALLTLVSCTNPSNANLSVQPAESIAASPSNSGSVSSAPVETIADQVQPSQATEVIATEPTVEQPPAAPTGNLLSPAQVAQLTELPIPIVAPTYLPEGFRVVRADGEIGEYANGDDDSGYTIEYQRDDNTCFAIYSSNEGPRDIEPVGRVESAIGAVNIYEENYEGRTSLQSFIPIEGNPLMISPLSHLNPETGEYEACQALDLSEYERILQSIEVVE